MVGRIYKTIGGTRFNVPPHDVQYEVVVAPTVIVTSSGSTTRVRIRVSGARESVEVTVGDIGIDGSAPDDKTLRNRSTFHLA
ncbi:MAG TPA: hypothetical protein VF597_04150 [Candidatus Saccharimonadales bacterium]